MCACGGSVCGGGGGLCVSVGGLCVCVWVGCVCGGEGWGLFFCVTTPNVLNVSVA